MPGVANLIQEIQLPKYEFYDNPIPVDRVDYDKSLNSMLQQTAKFAGVVSIYTREQEGCLGLGKIQAYYVLQDLVEENALRKGLIPTLRKIIHGSNILDSVRLYNQTIFQHIDQIMPLLNIKHQFGQEIRFSTLTTEERNFCYVLYVNDMLIMSPVNKLLAMLVDGVINVREAWQYLESMVDIIGTYWKVKRKIPATWQDFLNQLQHLGKNWFSMNLGRYQDLKYLIRQAVTILLEMMEDFHQYIQKDNLFFVQTGAMSDDKDKGLGIDTQEYRASFFTAQYKVLFIDHWDIGMAFHKMLNLYKKNKGECLYLPTLLSAPYVQYFRGIDYHSTLVQQSLLYHGYAANTAMPEILNLRNRRISEYLQFYEKYRDLVDYSAWLGYSIEPPSRLSKFLDKFLEKKRKEQRIRAQHQLSLELARV